MVNIGMRKKRAMLSALKLRVRMCCQFQLVSNAALLPRRWERLEIRPRMQPVDVVTMAAIFIKINRREKTSAIAPPTRIIESDVNIASKDEPPYDLTQLYYPR